MSMEVDWELDEVIAIKEDYDLSQLPDSPCCENLLKLSIQVSGLTEIPSTFFQHMPLLEELDLSSTNIQSLPSSITSLTSLQKLFLRDCLVLMELPSEIRMLTKLKLLDCEGSEIMYIPKEIRELNDLEVLRVSLSPYADHFFKTKRVNDSVKIPRNMLSKLNKLKELCITTCPEVEWWEEEVKEIQDDLCHLEYLETLKWYLPTKMVLDQFLQIEREGKKIYKNLSNFNFTIGRHPQLTSCLPPNLEKKFENFERCLKWINAEGNEKDISRIMKRSEALFLSRHWTIVSLSDFDLAKLKYCVLAECNEMETLFKLSEDLKNTRKVGLESIEYLTVHNMEKFQSIWKGPKGKDSLSRLRVLALHTCPKLNTVFTINIAQSLSKLTELTVEDCPNVTSLISYESPDTKTGRLFPCLERIFLLDLPKLNSIFRHCWYILEKVDSLFVYNCQKLKHLFVMELPNLRKLKGEKEWWNDLICFKYRWQNIFEQLKEDKYLIEQLAEATNSLQHFHDILLCDVKEKKPLDHSSLGVSESKGQTSDFPIGEQEGLSLSQPAAKDKKLPFLKERTGVSLSLPVLARPMLLARHEPWLTRRWDNPPPWIDEKALDRSNLEGSQTKGHISNLPTGEQIGVSLSLPAWLTRPLPWIDEKALDRSNLEGSQTKGHISNLPTVEQKGVSLSQPGMSMEVDWELDETIALREDYDLSQLPDSPCCENLLKLSIQVSGLTEIPSTFFEDMPLLEELDLSTTNIQSLPSSISCLTSLQKLFLRDCLVLMELPSEIRMLTKLKVLDCEGSEIMYIPKEIGELNDLEVLRVSLSLYADHFFKTKRVNDSVKIPRNMLSKLNKLKELCITTCPEVEWWEEEVKEIQDDLRHLEYLETLKWYLPTKMVLDQFLQIEREGKKIYKNLSNFNFTIGRHPQLTSCLPPNLEKKFENFERCLKWINAEGNEEDISRIMEMSEALFLSRHWTIVSLSDFNLAKLKYCVLAECNEMETLFEVRELSEDLENTGKVGLESIEYLTVHSMEKFQSIWKGPMHKDSLSRLRILALHTCPELTTIFTLNIAQNLSRLTELTIEDCINVTSLISYESPNIATGPLFPCLEKIFLLDLPELDSIFGGKIILEKVDSLLVYNCQKLEHLSVTELPNIRKLKGEKEWWNALICNKSRWQNVFEQLKEDRYLIEQLAEATNSLQHFNHILLCDVKDKKPLARSSLGMSETKGQSSIFPLGEHKDAKDEKPLDHLSPKTKGQSSNSPIREQNGLPLSQPDTKDEKPLDHSSLEVPQTKGQSSNFLPLSTPDLLPIRSSSQNFVPIFHVGNKMTDNRMFHHRFCSCMLCYNKHQRSKWGGTEFSSEDYDNSGNYDFESMDKLALGGPSLNSHKSALSFTSEDEVKVNIIIEDDNSVEVKVNKPPAPPSGSPLQDHFDYLTKYNRAGKGNVSKRSDMEIASIPVMKDAVVAASEIEISSNEYCVNTGTSQESGDAVREMDQQKGYENFLRSNIKKIREMDQQKGYENFLRSNIKKSFREFSRSSQHDEQGEVNVMVNGHPIPDRLVKTAEKLAGPIQPGDYWYDPRAGFWGIMGGRCLGIIPPFIKEFNFPMPEKCADGNTNVFVNGRELHQKDLDLLASRGLPTDTDRSYVIEISGRVLDEDSGEEIEGLGKLAPTVERQKHGFGMKPPRTAVV